MNLKDKKILVVGMGVSGTACAMFLKKTGADITITDMAPEKELGSCLSRLHGAGIKTEPGCHRMETFENADLIILSPGVPSTIPQIKRAEEKNIPVWGEIELASRFIKEPIIGITGTNGKTTTTTLLGQMLKNSGFKVFVGGNIGTPLMEYVSRGEKADIIVAELSSFQLDTIDEFRPVVSLLLNVSEDHLDRYTDMASYAESKGRIFKNQTKEDVAILNGSDPYVKQLAKGIKPKKKFFYTSINNSGGDGGQENFFDNNMKNKIDFSGYHLIGRHNMENAMAAAMAAMAVNGTLKGIQSALNNFKGLPHRLEHVAVINNISFFDDSKATNVDAVKRALQAFDEPVVLIMGGRDKGGGYEELLCYKGKPIKEVIVMGEAKEKIRSAFENTIAIQSVSSMETAVASAYACADSGDIILLSPACSSFDMFESYTHRGEQFKKAVLKIENRG